MSANLVGHRADPVLWSSPECAARAWLYCSPWVAWCSVRECIGPYMWYLAVWSM